jgi:photosystem II stability/assembly factor-like uncharacterized protein
LEPIRPSEKRWLATPATPVVRYDDIDFLSEAVGWAINSDGQILKTEDGGAHWHEQAHFPGHWLRSLSMVDERLGWVGGTSADILFKTTDGRSWQPVRNLPASYRGPDDADAPKAICGLHALPDGKHVFAAGTNFPNKPTRFLSSSDGGESWTCRDMGSQAALLVDVYFENEREGWLTGGRSDLPSHRRDDVFAAIWHTVDGGATWREVMGDQVDLPLGEWGWKIQCVDDDFIVVSTESRFTGSILISDDHGRSWRRREIRDAQGTLINCRLEGVGFLDRRRGWVGGWGGSRGDYSGQTSVTEDGGNTWRDATRDFQVLKTGARNPELTPYAPGQYINRFRVIGGSNPVIYAAGNTVYKYTDAPVWEPLTGGSSSHPLVRPDDQLLVTDGQISFTVDQPAGTRRLLIDIYDRFAGKVRTLADEDAPVPGSSPRSWDLADDHGNQCKPGAYVLRVSCDNRSESRMLFIEPHDVAPADGTLAASRFRSLTIPYRLR